MAIPEVIYLYPENTQTVQLQGLADVTTGLFLNSATVTATLFDRLGNADPVLNDIVMSYIATSNGNYTGTVPDTFNATLGGGYSLQITAIQAGIQSLWTIPVIIKLRSSIPS